MDKKYEELKQQKLDVEKDYSNLLKDMENNHLKAVEELENLYEKKLGYENEKYLQMESEHTVVRLKQNSQIENLKAGHRTTMDVLKGKFEEKFTDVEGLFKLTKENAKDLG